MYQELNNIRQDYLSRILTLEHDINRCKAALSHFWGDDDILSQSLNRDIAHYERELNIIKSSFFEFMQQK